MQDTGAKEQEELCKSQRKRNLHELKMLGIDLL